MEHRRSMAMPLGGIHVDSDHVQAVLEDFIGGNGVRSAMGDVADIL